jgi:hypothetical protein
MYEGIVLNLKSKYSFEAPITSLIPFLCINIDVKNQRNKQGIPFDGIYHSSSAFSTIFAFQASLQFQASYSMSIIFKPRVV